MSNIIIKEISNTSEINSNFLSPNSVIGSEVSNWFSENTLEVNYVQKVAVPMIPVTILAHHVGGVFGPFKPEDVYKFSTRTLIKTAAIKNEDGAWDVFENVVLRINCDIKFTESENHFIPAKYNTSIYIKLYAYNKIAEDLDEEDLFDKILPSKAF